MIRKLMTSLILAAVCILSTSAQEASPIPPESTALPEEGVVFSGLGRCSISPDETYLADIVDGNVSVFDLPNGAKRFDLPRAEQVFYSPDSRYLVVSYQGLYDAQTGELLIPNDIFYNGMDFAFAFSPDVRLYVEENAVYDLTTLEQIATLNRTTREDYHYPYYGRIRFINDGKWLYFENFDLENLVVFRVYVDTETWETILDGNNYAPGMGVRFSNDYTRYAVGGEGVFSYPERGKLFDLPDGEPEFSEDSSIILVTTYPTTSDAPTILTYLDAASGEQINRYERLADYRALAIYGLVSDPTLTRTILPIITQIEGGNPSNYLIQGWQVVEIATGTVIQQIDRDQPLEVNDTTSAYFIKAEEGHFLQEAFGIPRSDRRFAGERYLVRGKGIFDAETDALIFSLNRWRWLDLSDLGTYAYTSSPCIVWELPE